MFERPSVEQVTASLNQLPEEELQGLVDYRLRFQTDDSLLGIGGGDLNSGYIFIDCKETFGKDPNYQDLFGRLRRTVGTLAGKWTSRDEQHIERDAEAIAGLFYLAARLGAHEATPAVAKIAGNIEYGRMLLSRDSNLQSAALFSLAGLLDGQTEVRDQYRQIFEEALDSSYSLDVPIGLTTLCRFWPEEQISFIERARAHDPGNIEGVIARLDLFTTVK